MGKLTFLILSVLLCQVNCGMFDTPCGSGIVSSFLAYILTPSSIKNNVDNCCQRHDDQYDNIDSGWSTMTKQQSDEEFCSCLDRINSWFANKFIQPVFCATVRANSWYHANILGDRTFHPKFHIFHARPLRYYQ